MIKPYVKGYVRNFISPIHSKIQEKLFCQTLLKTAPPYTGEAAPPKEPELELFSEELKSCQTGPRCQ
jgi:hypothetical protein